MRISLKASDYATYSNSRTLSSFLVPQITESKWAFACHFHQRYCLDINKFFFKHNLIFMNCNNKVLNTSSHTHIALKKRQKGILSKREDWCKEIFFLSYCTVCIYGWMGGYLAMQKKETETMLYVLEQGMRIFWNFSHYQQLIKFKTWWKRAPIELNYAYICSIYVCKVFSYQHLKKIFIIHSVESCACVYSPVVK